MIATLSSDICAPGAFSAASTASSCGMLVIRVPGLGPCFCLSWLNRVEILMGFSVPPPCDHV